MQQNYFLSLFFSGLTKGSIYALIALGYTMVYGVVQLINFAHGEIYMIGAFTGLIAYTVFTYSGLPLPFILPAVLITSAVCAGAYGYTIEKIAYRRLRNAPRLSALITAIGMSLVLQNYVMLMQTSDFLNFPNLFPELSFLSGIRHILNSGQIIILASALLIMIILWFFITKTMAGKAMRAAAQDQIMAQLLGINLNSVTAQCFVIGSATAAIGGVLISAQTGQINFYIGFTAGLKAFAAAVLGGIGSIPGAVAGSLVLGFTESFGSGYISSQYEDLFAFVILIVILIFKPAGLFGSTAKEKV